MSAPTPAPGDDRPREGYYPDPSIPGYVRYWNGASWVPGTSRPAPTDGEPLAPPPGARPADSPAAPVEETGPHFFDEEPPARPAPGDAQHGSRPEPASAWGADRSRQTGFGGDQDRRVSWGAQQEGADPRVPAPAEPEAESGAGAGAAPDTFMMRRPVTDGGGARSAAPDPGTMAIRAVNPRAGAQNSPSAPGSDAPPAANAPQGPGFSAGQSAAERAAGAPSPAQPSAAAPSAAQPAAAPPSGPQQAAAGIPQQSGGPQPAPAASGAPIAPGPGGGQSSWAQQVHRLAEPGAEARPAAPAPAAAPADGRPVAPWKPVREDPFAAAALRQAAARPAGLGKRLAARLVDTIVLAAITAVAAVPLGTKALDHIDGKIEAAKLSGRTVTVWLLDGTTSVYLGIILAVLLVVGGLYEALPTAKWGRTLGKKLFGLEVRDIEAHEPPEYGAAVRRWLVYSVPGVLVIGVVGVLWCLFDRPWHQCLHDKAARTFVAG
ncbi:RDD family protein [Streptomyces nigra]|uniref:RDD family protein n=1 Tax=Streptomyces nigra TaxID=1827580 RepID=UPI00362CE5F8